MTDQTTATAAATNSNASTQSTAAAAPATGTPAADTAAVATQKPADSTTAKPADATASTPAKDGDKPADKPATDSTKTAATDDAAKAATDKAAKDAADAEAAKAATAKAPEKYEAFTLPDGVKIAPEAEAKIVATAKEFNLPQEGAQKLVNAAIELNKSFATQMDTKIADIRKEWETNSRNDKEFGGDNFDVNLAVANTAVRAFGSPAFKQLLKDSGVGSHPEFIRTFLNIGKSISQDVIVGSGDGVSGADASSFTAAASKLYGKK